MIEREREGGKEEGGEKESKLIIVLYYVIAYHADINLDHIYMYTCELHVNFIQVFAILHLWYMCTYIMWCMGFIDPHSV